VSISTDSSHIDRARRLRSGRVPIGSDRFAALRSRAGRAARARCLASLPAGACAAVIAIALAGCGGASHTSSTAAADVNGGGAAVTTTGTSTSQSGTSTAGTTSTSTATSTTSTASGTGHGDNPAPVHGGSGAGKGAGHVKAKSRKAAGRTAAPAGSGGGASAGGSSNANANANAPTANSGVPFEVSTTSMEPSFQPETKIYYDPTRTHPQIGEVVVFYLPAGAEEGACGEVMAGGRACTTPVAGMTKNKETSFKRVVGLPGDSIAIRAGHVIRNGQPESEPPTLPCEKNERLSCEFPTPIVVPAGSYYLMGDNRGLYKEDSRLLGAIPQEYILGTVEGG